MFTRPENLVDGSPEAEAFYASLRADRAYQDIRTDIVTFDARDAKGRVHGYSVNYASATYTRVAAEENRDKWSCHNVDNENLGTWYHVTPHALKDGKTFGALQPCRKFRTMAEAEAAGAAMIERARKASWKKK